MRKTLLFFVFLLLLLETPQLLTDSTAVTSYVSNILFRNNLHAVVDNRFYRSARMSNADLKEVIREKGIKTVINLSRGGGSAENGEMGERAVVESQNVKYLEIPLNGKRIPSRDRLLPLLSAYETSPLPILVHCSSGTHRSGLAAAIWLLEQEAASIDLAEKQLSARYGFFRFERILKSYFEGRSTIDEVLWSYKREMAEQGIPFSTWALQHLAPYDADDEMQNQCSLAELDLLKLNSRADALFDERPFPSPSSSFSRSLCSEQTRYVEHLTKVTA